ncbi:MAG: hypothetical protein KTR15_10690 [Phycisphaeraceae bacterium]|nr:hypothetical protein [Phycisphaeraceae bacterium]
MTVDPARLLQMLEPTVRPGTNSPVGGAQQGKPAFENRSFDDLLNEAKVSKADGTEAGEAKPVQIDPLATLSGIGLVENAGLREVLAQSRGTESGSDRTS